MAGIDAARVTLPPEALQCLRAKAPDHRSAASPPRPLCNLLRYLSPQLLTLGSGEGRATVVPLTQVKAPVVTHAVFCRLTISLLSAG
jgi:hypothetical protein